LSEERGGEGRREREREREEGTRKRMMGLEPTTFCMASGSWDVARERRMPHG
jgi:hypothetical protein